MLGKLFNFLWDLFGKDLGGGNTTVLAVLTGLLTWLMGQDWFQQQPEWVQIAEGILAFLGLIGGRAAAVTRKRFTRHMSRREIERLRRAN